MKAVCIKDVIMDDDGSIEANRGAIYEVMPNSCKFINNSGKDHHTNDDAWFKKHFIIIVSQKKVPKYCPTCGHKIVE